MRIPIRRRDKNAENTSMTSMIDVIFLLLIFFVCASAGQVQEAHLPTELAPGSVESVDRVVAVEKPFGEVWLKLHQRAGAEPNSQKTVVELNDREYVDDAALRQTLAVLAETTPEIPVILDIDGPVPLGDVVRVYDACQAANFQQISFATKLSAK
jgi:biopolymer transport protein ExbD